LQTGTAGEDIKLSAGITGTKGFEASTEREKLLMGRVAEEDREAFAELFDLAAPCILGVLIHLVRQRELAEEALQETFLQGWLQADHYRPELGSPRAWLLSIARSRGLDILRHEGSRSRREERVGAWEPRALPPVGTARLESRERQAQVRESLILLPAAQRTCLALAFGRDLAHPAIARELAMPLGSVKSRIRLGMRRLGGMLAADPAIT
jgi:RNA polymerase sigma-70 factor (ECF subfamily)